MEGHLGGRGGLGPQQARYEGTSLGGHEVRPRGFGRAVLVHIPEQLLHETLLA